jgi:hypothetical protein
MADTRYTNEIRYRIFNWLSFNYNGVRSPRVWADELGIKILDADGFEGVWLKAITLTDFLERVQYATIQPKQFDKR